MSRNDEVILAVFVSIKPELYVNGFLLFSKVSLVYMSFQVFQGEFHYLPMLV